MSKVVRWRTPGPRSPRIAERQRSRRSRRSLTRRRSAGSRPMTGGASGASTLRIDTGSARTCCGSRSTGDGSATRSAAIRVLRAPRQRPASRRPCATPTKRRAWVLMDFVVERPLTAFPGGEPALLRTLGEMVARLQATALFPPVMEDFGGARRGDAEPRPRTVGCSPPASSTGTSPAWPASAPSTPGRPRRCPPTTTSTRATSCSTESGCGSSTGSSLFRNDPLADVANIANNFSEVPNVDTLVLEGWLGPVARRRHPPPPHADARPPTTVRRLPAAQRVHRTARSGGRAHRTDAQTSSAPRSCVASYRGHPSCSSCSARCTSPASPRAQGQRQVQASGRTPPGCGRPRRARPCRCRTTSRHRPYSGRPTHARLMSRMASRVSRRQSTGRARGRGAGRAGGRRRRRTRCRCSSSRRRLR